MAIGLNTTLPMYRAVTGSARPFEPVDAGNSQIFGKPLLDYTPSPLYKTAPPAPARMDQTQAAQQDSQQRDARTGQSSALNPLDNPAPTAHTPTYPPTYTRSTQARSAEATGTRLNTKA